jgi:hypothetical protein
MSPVRGENGNLSTCIAKPLLYAYSRKQLYLGDNDYLLTAATISVTCQKQEFYVLCTK